MTEQEKREKVIKGLEICKEDSKLCFGESECGYQSCFPRCWTTLARDAIALLKAQEPRMHAHWEYKPRHRRAFRQYTGFDAMGEVHTITVCEESEGKEPYCGNCGAQAAESFMDYCPHCGAAMDISRTTDAQRRAETWEWRQPNERICD